MDDGRNTEQTSDQPVFHLVRTDRGEAEPYVPFRSRCRCGCGGVPGDCCCSA